MSILDYDYSVVEVIDGFESHIGFGDLEECEKVVAELSNQNPSKTYKVGIVTDPTE